MQKEKGRPLPHRKRGKGKKASRLRSVSKRPGGEGGAEQQPRRLRKEREGKVFALSIVSKEEKKKGRKNTLGSSVLFMKNPSAEKGCS